jgi:hypothetical protein
MPLNLATRYASMLRACHTLSCCQGPVVAAPGGTEATGVKPVVSSPSEWTKVGGKFSGLQTLTAPGLVFGEQITSLPQRYFPSPARTRFTFHN